MNTLRIQFFIALTELAVDVACVEQTVAKPIARGRLVMANLHVTSHAIQRFQERVRPVSEAEARQALSSTAIQIAIQIGAPFVKLGTGQHVVIRGGAIVSVLPREHHLSTFTQSRDASHQRDA